MTGAAQAMAESPAPASAGLKGEKAAATAKTPGGSAGARIRLNGELRQAPFLKVHFLFCVRVEKKTNLTIL